jgi:hypothetical protein
MFDRKFSSLLLVSVLVSFVFLIAFTGCGGGSPAVGPVTVTANAATVDGADTTTLSATVTNDRNSAGVTWTTSGGTLSGSTTTSTTFTAPGATSSAQTITVTATSIADTTKTGTATITVPTVPAITSLTSTQQAVAVGTAYSVQLAGTGGVSPYKSWALATGSGGLPSCLSLSSAGVLSSASTPTAACVGVYSGIKFTMTDSGTPNALTATSSAQTITVTGPTLTFPTSLTGAQVGTAYAASVAAAGALGTSTYSLASGSLAPDLSLNTSTGAITGTPKASDVGTSTFSVKAVDAFGDTATSGSLSITIAAAPAINFGTAPTAAGTFGAAYSSAVVATGGAGTLTYSLASGALPSDLALGSSGAITGTLSKAADVGTFTFAVKAADAYGDSATSGSYSIVVSYPQLTITTGTTLPLGYGNAAYSQTLAASGGSGTGYGWTVTSGATQLSALNLTLSSAGVLSGTPPVAGGSATFGVQVADSASNKASATFALTINAGVTITTPATLPAGYGSMPYSQTLAASGGSGSGYVWNITSGTSQLSAIKLNLTGAGVLSGTPPQAGGTATFSVQVMDSAANTATATFSLTINQGVIPSVGTIPDAYPGVAFNSSPFSATGGTGTGYNWSWAAASGSSLPTGFSLSAGGVISATNPVNTGTSNLSYNIIVTAADSSGNYGSINITLIVEAPIAIAPATFPSATVNVPYSLQLTASGGSGSYINWQVTTGASTLSGSPFNITLSKTGLLSGTPTTAAAGQTASFVVQATDSNGHSSIANESITVYNGLAITTTSLPSVDVGQSYNQTLSAAGGSGSGYTWSATNSNLSTYGLSLSSAGVVSGTSTQSGTASFTANVKDSGNNTSTQNLTFSIYSALTLPTPDPPSLPANGYTGVVYTGYINAVGGSGSYSWSVSGLPSDGLNVSGGTGGSTLTISGTPTSATTVTFNATLKDTITNATVTQNNYDIIISTPVAVSLPAPSPNPLPTATVSQNYTGNINASGGVGPYTWTVNGAATNGSGGAALGNGLSAVNTGGSVLLISGTPTSSGTVTLANVKVVDSLNTSATQTYTITVNPVSNLAISFQGIPQGMVNMPYTFNGLNISGGQSPYSVTFSNLPAGLQASTANTQWIVGTPTSSGSTTVTVKVTDSASAQQSSTFTLPVVPETVAANDSELKGQYACYVETYWDGGITGGNGSKLYRGGAVFAFSANGSGSITGGEVDSNSPLSGYHSSSTNGVIGGTYAVGSDNRGYMMLTAGGGPGPLFAIAAGNLNGNGQFTELALTEMDDTGASPTSNTGGGHCYQQNTTSLSGTTPSGGYVWAQRGEAGDGSLTGAAGYIGFSSGTFSGVMDAVSKGQYQGDVAMTGNTLSTADSFGRVTFNFGASGGNIDPFVIYLTNNSVGEAVVMSANPHNASSNAQFLVGEARKQVASALTANYPLNGSMVMYTGGYETPTAYKAQVMWWTLNSSSGAYTVGPSIYNVGGTIGTDTVKSGTWTAAVDATTGRMSFDTGDVMYVYNTGYAAVLLADGTTPQNQLGWVEPQTPPTSGTWALSSLATSVLSNTVSNGDYNVNFNSGTMTLSSTGAFTHFAQDDGGQNWADWDEPCNAGNNGQAATCVFTPDTTYDPNGTSGIFDAVMTPQGGTSQTISYCMAISVDKATNSSTRGRMVCLDATSKSPRLSIAQE